MKILLVEDNEPLAKRIKRQLSDRDLVDIAETAKEALDKLQGITYDVIIVDLNLPDMSGKELCQHIRYKGILSPILIMTAIDDIDTKVSLFNIGVDDYITKPFHAREFKARLTALGRRYPLKEGGSKIICGDLVLDVASRTAIRSGVLIPLRRKEFDILEYMLRHQGRVLTRRMIIDHAWDSHKTSWGSTVDVHIKNIRDKIDRPFSYALIKTSYGLGYRVDASNDVNTKKGEDDV